MNGLEQVKDAVAAALEKAGISAQTAYSPGWAKAYTGPVAAVGLRMGESRGAALNSYLGQRTDPETQVIREIYGIRLDLTLLEGLHQIMLEGLPIGLRPTELKWEEASWDPDTSMFLRRGSLACSACFIAAAEEDGTVFSDFILKGVVENEKYPS